MARNDDRRSSRDGSRSLLLIPLRSGRTLSSSKTTDTSDPRGVVSIPNRRGGGGGGSYTILGRVELMSCLFAACGCDPKNIFTTSNKCIECQQVCRWSMKCLSRQMLRITSKDKILSIRGRHALVVVGSSSGKECGQREDNNCRLDDYDDGDDDDDLDENEIQSFGSVCSTTIPTKSSTRNNDDWRWAKPLRDGMKLSLRELDGDGRLEFRIVLKPPLLLEDKNKEVATTKPPGGAGPIDDSTTTTTTTADINNKRNVHRDITNNKIEREGIYVYICSIGQDMPKQRLEILNKMAVSKGASIVSDFFKATHIVISKLVNSLDTLAENLGQPTNVNNLEEHIRVVSTFLLLRKNGSWIFVSTIS